MKMYVIGILFALLTAFVPKKDAVITFEKADNGKYEITIDSRDLKSETFQYTLSSFENDRLIEIAKTSPVKREAYIFRKVEPGVYLISVQTDDGLKYGKFITLK
jgi:hypothetical protein